MDTQFNQYLIFYLAYSKLTEHHTPTLWKNAFVRVDYVESPRDLGDVLMEANPMNGEIVLNAVPYAEK